MAKRALARAGRSFGTQRDYQSTALERVVATAQWPVPYQKRHFRAIPVRSSHLAYSDVDDQFVIPGKSIGSFHWLKAREELGKTPEGRVALKSLENQQLSSKPQI